MSYEPGSYTFTVCPLSKISFLDIAALRRSLGIEDTALSFTYDLQQEEQFSRRLSPEEMSGWWTITQQERIDQLKSKVFWNENSSFEEFRSIYADQDLELAHLLAYIDQFGVDGITTDYRHRPRDKYGVDREMLKAAASRSFSVRFPQAMLSPTFYLPFTANLILEVPDWSGNTERFGSLPNLVRELSEILDTVKALEPDAAVAGSQDIKHEDRLANAYNAARIKLDLTKVGLQQNLPFWFSE